MNAWTMPAWMEPYREEINGTEGCTIEESMNDTSTTTFNNFAEVRAQISLLYRLHTRFNYLLPALIESCHECGADGMPDQSHHCAGCGIGRAIDDMRAHSELVRDYTGTDESEE